MPPSKLLPEAAEPGKRAFTLPPNPMVSLIPGSERNASGFSAPIKSNHAKGIYAEHCRYGPKNLSSSEATL